MSYKGIQDLHNDFNTAISNVSGLNEFYMLNESEVNKLKNISYPVCISSIPNSSISDINRAYEEYEMVLLILKLDSKANSDYESLKIYDECVDLFSKLSDEVIIQRGGIYIVEEDSLEIERVSKLGNDLATGVRFRFKLLTPSKIGYPPSEIKLSLTEGLRAFYTTFESEYVTATSSSIDWSPIQNPSNFANLKSFNINNVPTFSNNLINFSNPNDTTNEECLKVNNVSTSGFNFTIIMSLYISNESLNEQPTLFSFDDGTLNSEFYAVSIVNAGGNIGEVNIVRKKSGESIVTNVSSGLNLFPYGSAKSVKNIAIVNDQSNTKTIIKTESSEIEVSGSRDTAISNMDLILGARRVISLTSAQKGFVGSLKNFAIYDGALTSNQIEHVFGDLDNI
tara:strand:+ start:4706 stop:5890 length:1185 start_codon:yes stop_codon:yes gene_type:complete